MDELRGAYLRLAQLMPHLDGEAPAEARETLAVFDPQRPL